MLHFFDDLDTILKEVLRLVKPGGIFAFTVATQTSAEEATNGNNPQDNFETPTPWGMSIFKHSCEYISKLLHANGLDILKKQQLVMRGWPEDKREDILLNALVAHSKRAA